MPRKNTQPDERLVSVTRDDWLRMGIDLSRVEKITVLWPPGWARYLTDDQETGLTAGSLVGLRATHSDWKGWEFGIDVSGTGGVRAFSVSLTPEAIRGDQHITARSLRKVPFSDLAYAVRCAYAWEYQDTVFAHEGPIKEHEGLGHPPSSDEYLVNAMIHYIDACADGKATEEAAKRFGVATHTMKGYRTEARRRGLFQSNGKGKAGGHLTARGNQVRKEAGL